MLIDLRRHVLGNYANAGIDSIELARAIVMNLSPENCFEAFELSSALGLRGISRAVLDVIEVSKVLVVGGRLVSSKENSKCFF